MKKERHGLRYTRFYTIWCGMKTRCYNKKHKDYKNYGAKGVLVWERWMLFSNFKEDMYESYSEHKFIFGEKDTTIERIDNKGHYELDNCRWATRTEQNNNKTYGVAHLIRNAFGRFIGSTVDGRTYRAIIS